MNALTTSSNHPGFDSRTRRIHVLTLALFAIALLYACSGAALLVHRPALVEFTDVFVAGLAPGVVITWLLGLANPDTYSRQRRQAMLALSLVGATIVAGLPLVASVL